MKQNIKILVVDDDPDVRFATARVIRKEGFSVIEAGSGNECIHRAGQEKPDIILLDVVLPDIEGPQVCKTIKADPFFRDTHIILISGKKTASNEQAMGLDCGADGYIARPISNQELRARVDSLVRILLGEREREQLIQELQKAIAEIKVLSGLLPLCSHCKKIRDDKGYWNQVEAYIEKHSDAEISHSICPQCAEKYYPDMGLYDDE